jgi:hypothetical protein
MSGNGGSAAGIETGYGLNRVRVPVGQDFSPLLVIQTGLGPTEPSIELVTGALSRGVKRPGREADHSPPASTEVKCTWIYTFTSQTSS